MIYHSTLLYLLQSIFLLYYLIIQYSNYQCIVVISLIVNRLHLKDRTAQLYERSPPIRPQSRTYTSHRYSIHVSILETFTFIIITIIIITSFIHSLIHFDCVVLYKLCVLMADDG